MPRVLLLFSFALTACTPRSAPPGPPADAAVASVPSASASAANESFEMPERPVPRTSPTVVAGMSAEIQMKAIGYMIAMAQPHTGDPSADATYAAQVAATLKSMAQSLDRGTAAEKRRLNRVEVGGGGRKIELSLAAGCSAETPSRAAQNAGILLSTLRSHGVLVVQCNDARVQCLQSTRDPTDILCTAAPRRK